MGYTIMAFFIDRSSILEFSVKLIAFIFTLLLPVPLYSEELKIEFNQALVQGALVSGWTNAEELQIDKQKIGVDGKGRFVFGLGRDTDRVLSIELLGKEGNRKLLSFNVKQRDYVTQRIEGVEQKYVSPAPEVLARIRREAQSVARARQTNRADAYEYLEGAVWPSKGPITGVYGSQRVFNGVPKRPHYGLDIAGPVGQIVVAPFSGKVTFAEDDLYYSGGTLIIDHGRGISSTFIHLSKLHVNVGDYVDQGQKIAEIGATGRVTGPHLDWRMNWFTVRLDPQLLLPTRK